MTPNPRIITRGDESVQVRRISRELTPAERERVLAVRRHVEEHLPELMAMGRAYKMQDDAARAAGKTLGQRRRAAGLSITEVANAAKLCEEELAQVESGELPPPQFDTLLRIADALGVKVSMSLHVQEPDAAAA